MAEGADLSHVFSAAGALGSYEVGKAVAKDKDRRRREQRKREREYNAKYRKRHKK